ncbi:MAG: glycosyltransferase family 61 protein [Pseudomonadota bacterium]
MAFSYGKSQLRLRVNAFSRLLRAAYHDTVYPAVDAADRRQVLEGGPDHARYQIHDYRGRLKLCPASGLLFDDNVLLKNSSDLFMRERLPWYRQVYDKADRHFPQLISLRHGSDANYWHFFQIVAPKAVIADLCGLPGDIPVVLSERQADIPFIKHSLDKGILGNRPVVIQGSDEVLTAERIFAILPPLHGSQYRDVILDRLAPPLDAEADDRLFVVRGKTAENDRRIRNQDEVESALAAFGFRTIDPQSLPLDQQIAAFARCGFIVSPHGAGMTNMIFRRGGPLDVVEIFNPNLVNDCYRVVADEYGFRYKALNSATVIGKPRTGHAVVDTEKLVDTVRRFLDTRGTVSPSLT